VGIGTTSPAGRLQVMGETEGDEEPVFEVKNKDGQTVFAVYNNGVRVYVDTSETKGLKGGFAVGGYGSSKGVNQDIAKTQSFWFQIKSNLNKTRWINGGSQRLTKKDHSLTVFLLFLRHILDFNQCNFIYTIKFLIVS